MNSSDPGSTQSNEQPTTHHLSCAACRVIDRADGVEDGQLWNPDHYTSPSRRNLFDLMRRVQDHTADSITSIAGSMRFVYIHVIWFGVWIALNVGLIKVNHEFDKFPFGLLTMIVSLEAIFLSTFVMISQNRADEKRQVLADNQWKIVQYEEAQNDQLIELTKQILELTKAIHSVATTLQGQGGQGQSGS